MTVTLSLEPEVEQALESRARARGLTLHDYLRELVLVEVDRGRDVQAAHLDELAVHIDGALAEDERGEGVDGDAFMHALMNRLDDSPAAT